MIFPIITIFVMLIAIVILILFLKDAMKDVDLIEYELAEIMKNLEESKSELAIFKERAESLENRIETDFGVSVRNITTVIKVEFTKLEMVTMMAGVFRLTHNSKTMEDAEYYIALSKKLQGFIDQMQEDEEEKSNGI